MTIKTGILAAAAALTLAIPAAALAQPSHGYARGYDRPVYGASYGRIERQREIRRQEELRRLRWERAHRHGHDHRYGR
jgi:hypothetical protein